jgi:hypothetical protein
VALNYIVQYDATLKLLAYIFLITYCICPTLVSRILTHKIEMEDGRR